MVSTGFSEKACYKNTKPTTQQTKQNKVENDRRQHSNFNLCPLHVHVPWHKCPHMLVSFLVNSTNLSHLGDGTSVKELSLANWPVDVSVGYFLNDSFGRAQPYTVGPDLYRKARWACYGEQASSFLSEFMLMLFLEFLPWLPSMMNYYLGVKRCTKPFLPQVAFSYGVLAHQ